MQVVQSWSNREIKTTNSIDPADVKDIPEELLNARELPGGKIHFMQNSISNPTGDFFVLQNVLQFVDGKLRKQFLGPVRTWVSKTDGKIWTLDHRRLAAAIPSGTTIAQLITRPNPSSSYLPVMNAPGPLTQLLDLQGMATAPDYSLRWVAPLADSHESISLALLAPDGFHHTLELEVAGYLACQIDDAAHPLPNGLYLLHPHATDTSAALPHIQAIRAWEDQHAAAESEQVHLVILLLPGLHIEAAITGAEYDFVHLQLDAHVQ